MSIWAAVFASILLMSSLNSRLSQEKQLFSIAESTSDALLVGISHSFTNRRSVCLETICSKRTVRVPFQSPIHFFCLEWLFRLLRCLGTAECIEQHRWQFWASVNGASVHNDHRVERNEAEALDEGAHL